MNEQERIDPPSPPLAAFLDEAREVEPEVDWAKIEARLFDASGAVRDPMPRREVRSGRVVAIASGLAIAAAFAIAILSPARHADRRAGEVAAAERPPLLVDGKKLAVGATVTGGENGAWIHSSGRIAIRVEPGSTVRVLDDGERVRLALDGGSVAADVVPVPGGEPFAVDVLGTRVAVHGTHLRVAVVGNAVQVAVSEGSAVVGPPRGAGRTEGTIVPSGAIATFGAGAPEIATDPTRATKLVEGALAVSVVVPPPPGVAAPPKDPAPVAPTIAVAPKHGTVVAPAAPTVVAPAAPVVATTNEGGATASGLSAAQLEGPLASVRQALQTCAPHKGAAVTSSFETTLTLTIDPKGSISGFSADLDPAMRDCFRVQLAKVSFPTAEAKTTVTRAIVLDAK